MQNSIPLRNEERRMILTVESNAGQSKPYYHSWCGPDHDLSPTNDVDVLQRK